MKRAAALALLYCAGAAAQPPAIAIEHLTEDEVAVIDVSPPGSPGKTFTAMTMVDATPAKLCGIVQDYAAYGRYMPNTRSAQVVTAPGTGTGNTVLVDMTLDLPMGKVKRYRIALDAKQGAGMCQLNWKLVPRDDLKTDDTIADTTGYWLFTPSDKARGKSVVQYHVYADPGPVPYGLGWIVDLMSKRSLPRTLEALRGEAQRRAQQSTTAGIL